MKNYSSKRAKKGKTAYRTPSKFIAQKTLSVQKNRWRPWHVAQRLEPAVVRKQK